MRVGSLHGLGICRFNQRQVRHTPHPCSCSPAVFKLIEARLTRYFKWICCQPEEEKACQAWGQKTSGHGSAHKQRTARDSRAISTPPATALNCTDLLSLLLFASLRLSQQPLQRSTQFAALCRIRGRKAAPLTQQRSVATGAEAALPPPPYPPTHTHILVGRSMPSMFLPTCLMGLLPRMVADAPIPLE